MLKIFTIKTIPFYRYIFFRRCTGIPGWRATTMLLLLASVLLVSCDRKKASGKKDKLLQNIPITSRLVEVVEVGSYSFDVKKTYIGHLEPNQRVKLQAETGGVMEKVNVIEGKKVVEKQEMFRISTKEIVTRRNLARTNYQLSNAEYQRSKKLHVDKLISPAELERTFNAREVARLNLKLADLEYDKSVVRAPFDGFTFQLSVTSGEFIKKGRLLAEVLDVSRFKAAINVPEEDIRFFTPDLKIKLFFDALPGWKQEGQIFSVGQEANQNTRDFTVEIVTDSTNEQLRSGMLVRVQAQLASFVNQVLVPLHALIERDDGTFVFIVQREVSVLRRVETGVLRGNLVQINEGLRVGELLVVSGQHKLTNEVPVRVRKIEMDLGTEIGTDNNPDDT